MKAYLKMGKLRPYLAASLSPHSVSPQQFPFSSHPTSNCHHPLYPIVNPPLKMASINPARPSTPTKRPLHILCFGDSLTEGYSQWGMVMTPYSRTLRDVLEKRLNAYGRSEGEKEGKEGEKWNVLVETDGVSGELVTKYFLGRMESQCKSYCLSH